VVRTEFQMRYDGSIASRHTAPRRLGARAGRSCPV